MIKGSPFCYKSDVMANLLLTLAFIERAVERNPMRLVALGANASLALSTYHLDIAHANIQTAENPLFMPI